MEKSAEEADGGLDVHPKTETTTPMSRKEKRKAMKKMKRKQARKEIALKDRQQQDDPQELLNMKIREQEEAERSERDRKLFEERERAWIEAMELRNRKRIEQQQQQIENANEDEDDDDNLEYEKEERAEFIWQGNEITLIKKKVRVPKRDKEGEQTRKEDSDRPTSNPLPPQSEAFSDHKYGSLSAQQLIETVAEQVPHFGTEKDKDHCPFHLKTGACRFGHRCSRVHFYPDKSSTLLIRNMYNGPGLAWEQGEGLEQSEIICEFTLVENQVFSLGCTGNKDNVHQYTDEEVERSYEEFYEDVHTEFLKFGEIINFKVCRNGAFHLRGNVYVQYSAVESAVLAHQFISGRYFAGKQISCEFINVTKWKAAICGEYAKSNYQTCSRGTACNFIHCFRNPGADYEWADRDKSPPNYWVEKMVALFGYSDVHKKYMMDVDSGQSRNSGKMSAMHSGRYGFRRSSSRERNYSSITASGRRYDDEDYALKGTGHQRPTGDYKYRGKTPDRDRCEENTYLKDYNHKKSRKYYTESDGKLLDRDGDMHSDIYHCQTRKSSRQERDHENKIYKTESDGHVLDRKHNRVTEHGSSKKSSSQQRTSRVQNNNGDCKKKVHEVDRDLSTTDRDRESYRGSRSSGHKRKAGYADDHKYRKSRAHDSDRECSDSNSRDDEHHSMRKSLGHIDNASKYSLDRDAEIEASHARKQIKHPDKLDGRSPAQDQKHKNSGDEADDCVKDLRAHDSAESYRSDQNNVRYITDVQIGKPDRWEPEPGSEERHDSEGKAESFESCEFRRSERHNRRDESSGLESESYSIDKVGEAHHHENRMSRKKSSNNNGDRAGGKRSRGTSQFSHRRCSNSSGEATDSADDDKESRRYKKHHASHKPHNSRDLKSHH